MRADASPRTELILCYGDRMSSLERSLLFKPIMYTIGFHASSEGSIVNEQCIANEQSLLFLFSCLRQTYIYSVALLPKGAEPRFVSE